MTTPPILANKNPVEASVFAPAALLREARRQKVFAALDVPAVCILDPDGDLVRQLRRTGAAKAFEADLNARREDEASESLAVLPTIRLAGTAVSVHFRYVEACRSGKLQRETAAGFGRASQMDRSNEWIAAVLPSTLISVTWSTPRLSVARHG